MKPSVRLTTRGVPGWELADDGTPTGDLGGADIGLEEGDDSPVPTTAKMGRAAGSYHVCQSLRRDQQAKETLACRGELGVGGSVARSGGVSVSSSGAHHNQVRGRMNARLLDVRASLGRGVATSDGGSGAETDTGSGKHDD